MPDIEVVDVTPQLIELVEVVTGPPGPPGADGSAGAVVHAQTVASATWTIAHAIGRRPVVAVYVDDAEVLADVDSTPTQTVITFAAPCTGTATLI